jgi:hypothetical protein
MLIVNADTATPTTRWGKKKSKIRLQKLGEAK